MTKSKGPYTAKSFTKAWIEHHIESGSGNIDYATAYGEPGYSTDKPYILFSNWNDHALARLCGLPWERETGDEDVRKAAETKNAPVKAKLKRLTDILETQAELEWSDEWTIVYDSQPLAFRTSPDSHGWTPAFVSDTNFASGDIVPLADIEGDDDLQDEYIASIIDNPSTYCKPNIQLEAHRFQKLSDHENGWHPGQTDVPRDVLARAKIQFPSMEFVFGHLSKSQFSVEWELWGRDKETEQEKETA
jgi:hypothetical protein